MKKATLSRSPHSLNRRSLHLIQRISRRRYRQTRAAMLHGSAAVLALWALLGFNPQARAATETWVGNTSVNLGDSNWTGVNNPPLTGDSLVFGVAGTAGTNLLDNLFTPGTYTINGITFNSAASGYTITAATPGTNGFTLSGGITDAGVNTETLNDLITLSGSETFTTDPFGGNLTFGGAISSSGGNWGITAAGGGTVTLDAANTYAGTTVIYGNTTLALNFNASGAPATNIAPAGVVSMAGGTVSVIGASSGANTQSFSNLTLTGGQNIIAATNNGTAPTVNLGTITVSGVAGGGFGTLEISATGTLATVTTTTLGGGAFGLLGSGVGANSTAGYATYGLYDWATTDTTAGTAGSGTATIRGLGSVAGGYVTTIAQGTGQAENWDLQANETNGNNWSATTVRFNTPAATTINVNSKWLIVSGILVTPNMGANNAQISGGNFFGDYSNANTQNMYIWQNNTSGYFINSGGIVDGRAPLTAPNNAHLTYIQSGPGTVEQSSANGYSGQTYLNGGFDELTSVSGNAGLGYSPDASPVNLNGGTIVGAATLSLDNNGANARPIVLDNAGGGVAAISGFTLTVDGLVSGSSGSGPLIVGIPASSANGKVAGLLPGTGAGTANTTALLGTGTVVLNGTSNSFYGGVEIVGGATLNINSEYNLGGANYGGITFNNGILQYNTNLASGVSGSAVDLTTNGVTAEPVTFIGNGTIDLNGHNITFANSIGNSGTGSLIVANSASSSNTLTLNGNNTFTGGIIVNHGATLSLMGSNAAAGTSTLNGSLILNSGASLGNTAITIDSTGTLLAKTGNGGIGSGSANVIFNGGNLSLVDGSMGTLAINGGLTINGAGNIDFDLGAAGADSISISGAVTGTGSDKIFITTLGASAPANGQTYTLITAASGLGTSLFSLGTTSLTFGAQSYTLSLSTSTGNSEILTANLASLNYYWTGHASSSWSTLSNFAINQTGTPAQTQALSPSSNVFLTANSASNFSQTLDGNYTINSLSFTGTGTSAAANPITLASGGAGTNILTINGANTFSDAATNQYVNTGLVVQPGSAAHTISANINLGNSQNWQINNSSANPLTVSGVISDAPSTTMDSLTTSGAGTLILTASNAYDGGTVVSGGTLMLGAGGALANAGALTVSGSGTFDLGGNSQTVSSLSDGGVSTGQITSSNGPGVLTIINATANNFGGTITDNNANNSSSSLALALRGSSNVTLSGSNSFTGGTTLYSGNLTVASNYALGSPTSQNAAAGLNLGNSGPVNIYFTSANPQLAAFNDTNVPSTGQDNIILGNATNGGSATTLNIGAAGGNSTIDGVISDLSASVPNAVGNLSIIGGGYVVLGAANTFTGTTTISGSGPFGSSELALTNASALQYSTLVYNDTDPVDLPLAVSFGSLSGVTLAGLTGVGNLPTTATITIGSTNLSTTFLGNLSGAASVVKNGSGTWQIGSGTQGGGLYTGSTTITQGTVIIGGTSNMTGSFSLTGANGTSSLVIQDDAIINNGSALQLETGVGSNGYPAPSTVVIAGTANATFAGITFGTGAARVNTGSFITVQNSASLIDNGTLNFMNTDGGTSTQGGTVLNLNGGTFATQNFILTNYGGNAATTATLNLNGGVLEALANDPTGSFFLPVLARLTVNVLTGGAIINTNGYNVTVTQPLISGTANDGGLTKIGAGTLYLAGANTYVGPTHVNGGILNLASASAIPASSAITFGGGVLQYTSTNTTDYSARIVNSTGPVAIGVNGQSITFATPLAASNIGGLSVQDAVPGVGSLTLNGANNYSGPTTVNSGAVLILASGAGLPNSAVTVNGTLLAVTGNDGIGSGSASLDLGAGSTLSLVDGAIGALNVDGSMTIGGASAAAINLEVNTDAGTNDTINVTGGPVTLGAGGAVINLTDLSATTAPANNTEITLITDPAGGLGTNGFQLGQSTLFVDGQSFVLSLANSTADDEIVTLTAGQLNYYWTGKSNSSWTTASNFATDPTGAVAWTAVPGKLNNVFLTANTASNFSPVLNANYTINSLSFTGTGTSAGSNSITLANGTASALTINAASTFSDANSNQYVAGIGLVTQVGAAADFITANINLGNSQTWEIDSSNPLAVSGVISDGSTLDSLTKTGTGTLILTNAEAYDGGTIVKAGTLALGSGGSLLSTSTLTVTGSGTFDLAGQTQTLGGLADGGMSTGTITTSKGEGVLFINDANPSSYGGAITDNQSTSVLVLIITGTSNLTLSGSSNFNGGTGLESGNLTVAGNYALGNPNSTFSGSGLNMEPPAGSTENVYFTSANPNIASLNNPEPGTSNVILGNTSGAGSPTTLNIGPGSTGTSNFTGTISDQSGTIATAVGSVNVYGGATLVLTATNTYKGDTTITGAGSQVIINSSLTIENSILNLQGGTLNLSGLTAFTLGGLTGSNNFALISGSTPLALTVGNDNDTSSYSGNLSGPGSVSKVGTGLFTVSDATYTGNTVVYNGSMTFTGSTNLMTHLDISAQQGVASVVVNGATLTSTAGLYITSPTGGTGTIYGNNANLTIEGGAQVTALPDANGRAISYGAGNGRPSGNGFLTIGTAGDTTTLVTANGALDLFYTSGGATGGNFALNLNGGTLAVNNIQKTGGGGTQSSTVNFNGGVLEALASDPSGSVFLPFQAAGLTVNVMGGGAIINTNGFSDTIAQPMLSGTANDGGLTKNGAGSLILTATNTYVGPTNVNAGNLVLSGSAGTGITKTSAVTVAAGANLEVDTTANTADTVLVNGQLSGNGGTVGPVNVTSTGALAPGLSTLNAVAGNLTSTGNVTFAGTSVFSIRLGVATALDSDELSVPTGAANLNDATLSLTLGNAFNGGAETPGFLYVLINGGAGATGSGTDVFSNAPASGSMLSVNGSTFEVLYAVTSAGAPSGSDVDLEFVAAVPEPATWAEILAGAAVLCVWQRSRRKVRRGA